MRKLRWLCSILLTAASLWATGVNEQPKLIVHFRDFEKHRQANGLPEGWTTWSPRPEIAPRFSVAPGSGRNGGSVLQMDGNDNPGVTGAWKVRVNGIRGNARYRLIAYFRSSGVTNERRSISARLEWLDDKGLRARPPEFALDTGRESGRTRVEYLAQAPEKAQSLVIELLPLWAPKGSVWWDDIQIVEEPGPRTWA